MRDAAYLDYNATAPIRPEVAAAMGEALLLGGNPSSVHGRGRAARQAVEKARRMLADAVGVRAEEVIFAGGGTEANHLALLGPGFARVMVSAIEHDSVRAVRPEAEILPVDPAGAIDCAALAARLAADPRPALVSVMAANNETGVVQPVAEAARLVHAHGGLLHCDAVQALGKLPLDRAALGADLLSLSAHKIGGPQGVGALIAPAVLALAPLLRGGGQERGRRAGTENVAGIVGFGLAARIAAEELGSGEGGRLAALRDRAEARLSAIEPAIRIFGRDAGRLPNTLAMALPGFSGETLVMALDLEGVQVSAGAACSSGKVRRSHVLLAMGASPEEAEGAIRISLGWGSREEDIDRLVTAWSRLHARFRAGAAR